MSDLDLPWGGGGVFSYIDRLLYYLNTCSGLFKTRAMYDMHMNHAALCHSQFCPGWVGHKLTSSSWVLVVSKKRSIFLHIL